jgi:hypothetical protein
MAVPGPRICGVEIDRLCRTSLRGDRRFKRFPLARLRQCAYGAQRRIERAARPRGDRRPRLLDPGDASAFRLTHEGKPSRANEPAPNLSVGSKAT